MACPFSGLSFPLTCRTRRGLFAVVNTRCAYLFVSLVLLFLSEACRYTSPFSFSSLFLTFCFSSPSCFNSRGGRIYARALTVGGEEYGLARRQRDCNPMCSSPHNTGRRMMPCPKGLHQRRVQEQYNTTRLRKKATRNRQVECLKMERRR